MIDCFFNLIFLEGKESQKDQRLYKRFVQGVIERLIHDKLLVVAASDQLSALKIKESPATLYRVVYPASNVNPLGLLVYLLSQKEAGDNFALC